MALGTDVIFLGLDVVAAGDIIKAVKVAKVANTEAKAANNVMDEYVATPENAGMPNAVKRESRDNLILFIGSVMVRNIIELYMKHYRSRMSPQQSFGQAWIIQTL